MQQRARHAAAHTWTTACLSRTRAPTSLRSSVARGFCRMPRRSASTLPASRSDLPTDASSRCSSWRAALPASAAAAAVRVMRVRDRKLQQRCVQSPIAALWHAVHLATDMQADSWQDSYTLHAARVQPHCQAHRSFWWPRVHSSYASCARSCAAARATNMHGCVRRQAACDLRAHAAAAAAAAACVLSGHDARCIHQLVCCSCSAGGAQHTTHLQLLALCPELLCLGTQR